MSRRLLWIAAAILILIAVQHVSCRSAEPRILTTATSSMPQAELVPVAKPQHVYAQRDAKYDPYEDWETWCEGDPTPCKATSDCAIDRTGRHRKCVQPFWAKDGEKVCAIPQPRRSERKATQAMIARIVDAQCGHGCDPSELARYFDLVAARESTWRPWKQHRLSGDVRASATNWLDHRHEYKRNRHYMQEERWQGWGLLGQQSVLFANRWDAEAPPEILCRPPVAIATYLNCMRRSHVKQRDLGITPTWETLHSACSSGKIRPTGPNEDFRKRAARVGLDPERQVSLRDLGTSPGKSVEFRNLTLGLIEASLDTHRGAAL